MTHYKHSRAEHARQYGVSLRSVDRYRSQGMPLDDPTAMQVIFAAQQSSPLDKEDAGDGPPNIATAIRNARLDKIILECKRLAFRNDVEAGRYSLNEDIRAQLVPLMAELQSELRRQLENELPPKCEGLAAPEIQMKMREALDAVLAKLSRGLTGVGTPAPDQFQD